MDIFMVFSFLGGLALFLYGMRSMGQGLEALGGGSMKALLARLCSTTWRGVLVGAAVTAAIQSSSATTVMVIGFVNSGLMQLNHAVGVIMGANLGTTVTSWILSLTGIEGDSVFLRLLKPASLASLLALSGVVLIMSRRGDSGGRTAGRADGSPVGRAGGQADRRGRIGAVLAGLGILFFGMEMMSTAVEPLAGMPGFVNMLTLFSNPIMGVVAGMVMTAVVQSSSAAIGILQALSAGGSVTFSAAIPIVMGQNIGTCVTTLISSVGASKNAKRAAFVHLYFNVIGAAVLMAVFYGLNAVFRLGFYSATVTPMWIATIHTVFNVLSVIILYPFAHGLQRLAEVTVARGREGKERREEPTYSLLDPRFLRVPATALEMCRQAFGRMLGLAKENFSLAAEQIVASDERRRARVTANEKLIDSYEDDLGSYMIKLSSTPLGERDTAELTKLMYAIGDVERIGDHAESLAEAAVRLKDTPGLSSEAEYEFGRLMAALEELLDITSRAVMGGRELLFEAGQSGEVSDTLAPASDVGGGERSSGTSCPLGDAGQVEPLSEVIDGLCEELREHHIQRLQSGVCTAEAAAVYDGMLIDAQRISAHCSNIAVSVIQRYDDRLTAHRYLRGLHENDLLFRRRVAEFAGRWGL